MFGKAALVLAGLALSYSGLAAADSQFMCSGSADQSRRVSLSFSAEIDSPPMPYPKFATVTDVATGQSVAYRFSWPMSGADATVLRYTARGSILNVPLSFFDDATAGSAKITLNKIAYDCTR